MELVEMHYYLPKTTYNHNFQRVKINANFSDWKEIKAGVPQGSVLGPPLFNIFIKDIFINLDQSKLCNYADDNTI